MKQKPKNRTTSKLKAPSSPENFLCTTAQVGAFFGITAQRVNQWVQQQGCPKLGHGQFDLKAVFDWWVESDMVGARMDETAPELKDARLEYWKWQAEEKKVKTLKLKEQLIPRDDIAQMYQARMGEVISGLQAFSYRLPPLLDGMTQTEMQSVIDEEVWKLRDNYCREGKFCPPHGGNET
jgi:hypothetical protein